MSDPEIIYEIAIPRLSKMTPDLVRALPERGVTLEDFFSIPTPELTSALGLSGSFRFEKMERDEALFNARKEYELMQKHNITGHFILNEDYPFRLSQANDAPIFYYQIGTANLDSQHVVSVVGTRRPTPYGIDFCKKLISDLAAYFPDLLVVSGLAYGIDAAAHTAALEASRPTVAVVAHGLNMIYPAQHRDLARKIVKEGGAIISEYPFCSTPYRQRFLERNRIVAALPDAVVVVESDIKGGAMSTANTAFSYSREVMALPGRISDQTSSGCNHLIRKEKAHLITCGADLIEILGWQPLDIKLAPQQRNLFPELDGDSKLIYDTLRFSSDPMQTDRLHMQTQIPIPRLMSTLGEMEFDGIVIRHPGNRYSIA